MTATTSVPCPSTDRLGDVCGLPVEVQWTEVGDRLRLVEYLTLCSHHIAPKWLLNEAARLATEGGDADPPLGQQGSEPIAGAPASAEAEPWRLILWDEKHATHALTNGRARLSIWTGEVSDPDLEQLREQLSRGVIGVDNETNNGRSECA